MGELIKGVSYIKGMMAGMRLDTSSDENKLIAAIVDLLDDMAAKIAEIETEQFELGEFVENIDADLIELEDAFGDFGFSDEELHDGGDGDDYIEIIDNTDDDEDLQPGPVIYPCPHCKQISEFFPQDISEDALCPHCGKRLQPDGL